MLIEWKEKYNTGFQEIDRQHKNIIVFMNDLYDRVNKKDFGDVDGMFDLIEVRTNEHFTLEEGYFEEFGFELADEHKQIHRDFLEKIAEIKDIAKDDKIKASFDLIDYLEDWFIAHITVEDRKYIELFKSKGLS